MKNLFILVLSITLAVAGASAQEVETTSQDSVLVASAPVLTERVESPIVVDTLATDSPSLSVLLLNDGTWRYIESGCIERDSTLFASNWSNDEISVYKDVSLSSLPKSVPIRLVDTASLYRYPHYGRITSRYGVRHRRNHNGIDIALKVGDTICAAFNGKVRFSKCTDTGYGTLVIIRHDNGLETYHGHLSKRLVEENERVIAGQPIALGGNSGRSTGPHLHFECRYMGQSFDPERLFDFKTGELRREKFLLRRSYFSIYSKYMQDFNAEEESYAAEKRENEAAAERRYYKVRSGDYLGRIAKRNHTTVSAICRLNGIKPNTVLKIGRVLRVK